jgi:PAS domain S-box-containing protein
MIDHLHSKHTNFLSQEGASFELIRSIDWQNTSLGPVETWPQSLRSALSICLNSNFPIAIYWGADLVLIYNEAWSPIPGNKHPWALGKPAVKVWPDIWDAIEPQFQKALSGQPGGSKDALLPMQRHGYTEECYFDFTFTPVYGESGNVEGVFNAVIETTYRVINERRGAILQRLGDSINSMSNEDEVFSLAKSVLENAQEDIPFFFIYENRGGNPVLRAKSKSFETTVGATWPVDEVLREGSSRVIDNLEQYFEALPKCYWPEPTTQALIVPLKANDGNVSGFIVGGISARRKLDKEYKNFYESISNVLSGKLNTLQSLNKERERAESLAQLDKAKTAFFSNISHEFRTPLTLMLSPLEEVLTKADYLKESHKVHLETSLRNSLRLQKLVNTLLDFSKIEAGKLEANFKDVNIAQLTTDLASSFRSAIESAGLEYEVHVEEVRHSIRIDAEMWEKIVLNLISNAFKYTNAGRISVTLREENEFIKLLITDTGVGIPEEHREKVFERFYRINNQGGRTQEGTGIGLALVKELVLLHKGQIDVESKPGEGTTFTVTIPVSNYRDELPTTGEGETQEPKSRKAFIDEASQWVGTSTSNSKRESSSSRAKVIVADDNPDMLQYITRLLSEDFDVHPVNNGEEALTTALDIDPDLILSDIMMPKLDGFGLLKKLKANLATKNIPVIFLSARAGEEARVEGIEAGANDYLVKPFSSKELQARVANQIAINKARRETEKQFFNLFLQLPAHIHVFSGPEHVVEFFHPLGQAFIGRDITGMKVREALPELEGQGFFELLDKVYQTGETISIPASRAVLPGPNGKPEDFYFSLTYLPWRDSNGNIRGVIQFTFDVTEQTKVNAKIKESEERFRILANSIPQFVWMADDNGAIEFMSNQWEEYTGIPAVEGRKLFSTLIHDEDVGSVRNKWGDSLKTGTAWTSEFRLKDTRTGEYRWFFGHTVPLKDEQGNVVKWIGSASDIHRQKTVHFELEGLVAERTSELIKLNNMLVQKNEELARAQNFLQTVLDSSVELVTALDTNLVYTFANMRLNDITDRKPEELIGRNILELNPGFEKTEGYDVFMRALKGETIHIESTRPYADRSLVFETFVIPLKHHGEVSGIVTMERDITNIVKLTENLQASNEQLKRSNEDLQQFAHVTSHDLKEPVRKIKMYGNILADQYTEYLPEKAKEYLSKIERSTGRISAMIDGVLQYATIEVTDQFLEDIDLGDVMQSIVEDLEIPIREYGAVVEYKDLPVIKGYPTLIYQLFYNLINNSLKFRRKDLAPVIRVSSSELSSVEEKEVGPDYFKIQLNDNGIGFDATYAEKIFESFTRLNSKDKYEGTGLGLALCRKIVLRHKGLIKATGEPYSGACFCVYFPKAILSKDL